ncbi:MAG: 50S ribosomal protein L25 [Pirellulaceae bacterium]|jgi:large subunit ribosomal protein L25
MIETIEAVVRDAVGTRQVMKLRGKRMVPAILYGHGEANVLLSLREETVAKLLKSGARLVNLTGAIKDTALVRDMQWDSMGNEVIHLDFARVSATEMVDVTLPVVLHGEAIGLSQGGQLRFQSHQLAIRCPAGQLPEHIVVDVTQLQVGQAIHAGEVKLPVGAVTVTPANEVVVQVVVPSAASDEAATATGAEPELIRKEKAAAEEKDKK